MKISSLWLILNSSNTVWNSSYILHVFLLVKYRLASQLAFRFLLVLLFVLYRVSRLTSSLATPFTSFQVSPRFISNVPSRLTSLNFVLPYIACCFSFVMPLVLLFDLPRLDLSHPTSCLATLCSNSLCYVERETVLPCPTSRVSSHIDSSCSLCFFSSYSSTWS